VVGRVGF